MAQAARKITAKDANEKLAHRRLTVLELAERLGNVAEVARRGHWTGGAMARHTDISLHSVQRI